MKVAKWCITQPLRLRLGRIHIGITRKTESENTMTTTNIFRFTEPSSAGFWPISHEKPNGSITPDLSNDTASAEIILLTGENTQTADVFRLLDNVRQWVKDVYLKRELLTNDMLTNIQTHIIDRLSTADLIEEALMGLEPEQRDVVLEWLDDIGASCDWDFIESYQVLRQTEYDKRREPEEVDWA
jgi:hypothetical protein